MRKREFLVLVLVMTLLAGSAGAFNLSLLPESSFKQGMVLYGTEPDSGGALKGRIEFAVYDTNDLQLDDETTFTDALGLLGQYVYAYQVFNNVSVSVESVGLFQVLNLDGTELADGATLGDTGSHDDQEDGIEPTGIPLEGAWEWTWDGGYVLGAGERSSFLVYSSDYAPIAGTYEIVAGGFPIGGNGGSPAPEPATIALLGLGGTVLLGRRKRVVH